MRKTFLALMLLTLAAGLTSEGTSLAGSKDLKIAMIQWRGDTKACQGFRDGLKELGYSVEYTILNADQDKTRLGHILREQLQPKLKEFDYIYTFGTTVTKATKLIVNDQVPQIFTIVVDPVGAGIVQSMDSSGANISGASNSVSLALQLDTALKVVKFRRLGLLFNPREKNTALVREKLQELAVSRELEIVDLRSPPALNTLKANLRKLKDKSVVVDAIYLPTDTFILTNSKLVVSELNAAKIRSIAAIRQYVKDGALMGLVPDFYKLGKGAAVRVDRHQKGVRLADLAIFTDKEPKLVVNMTTAQALKVDIPEELLAKAITIE